MPKCYVLQPLAQAHLCLTALCAAVMGHVRFKIHLFMHTGCHWHLVVARELMVPGCLLKFMLKLYDYVPTVYLAFVDLPQLLH